MSGSPVPLARRPTRPLVAALLLVGFLLVAASLAYIGVPWNLDADPWEAVATMKELRARDVIYLEEHDLFLVSVPTGVEGATAPAAARKRGVMAFTNDATHLPGEPIRWCASAEVFYSPRHGEKFDRFGAFMAGPAPGGLDRVAVRVTGDEVFIDPTRVFPGPDRGVFPVREPAGRFCQD